MPIVSLLCPIITHQYQFPSLPFPYLPRFENFTPRHVIRLRGIYQYIGWTTVRDYRIVRITPWNETSSRERNNIADELRYFFFLFLLFVIYYLAFKEKREGAKWKERNDRREGSYVYDVDRDCSTRIFRFITRLITANFEDPDRGYINLTECQGTGG